MKLYLSSYEYNDFEIPRKVLQYQKIKLDDRNALVIEVDKPLIGQKYGLLNKDCPFPVLSLPRRSNI